MPIYDYECKECGVRIEVFLSKPSAPRSLECKRCGGKMEKKISTIAPPKFKGTGFYETDFKHKR